MSETMTETTTTAAIAVDQRTIFDLVYARHLRILAARIACDRPIVSYPDTEIMDAKVLMREMGVIVMTAEERERVEEGDQATRRAPQSYGESWAGGGNWG